MEKSNQRATGRSGRGDAGKTARTKTSDSPKKTYGTPERSGFSPRPSRPAGRGFGGGRSFNSGRPSRASDMTHEVDYSMYQAAAITSVQKKEESFSQKFDTLGCSEQLLKLITKKGYTHASEIQARVIPQALQGFDILGLAETGSGKTAAFLLPLIERVLADDNTTVLVLAPTRELADQINAELRSFTIGMRIFSTVCVGGMPIYRQAEFLKRQNHFIIGTPGRIEDLVMRRMINLDNITAVVLDEVDYMMDIGFVDAMTRILDRVPETRQTFFFSATMPPKIQSLCERYLRDPEIVDLPHGKGSNMVEQDIVRIPRGGDKIVSILEILKKPETQKTILFCDTKHEVERVCNSLKAANIRVAYLHGGLDQRKRFNVLTAFKNDTLDILIASDVAARGIDVKNITTVINYAPPQTHEDYVHRIGRAGRAGTLGYAYTLFFEGEKPRTKGGRSGGGGGQRRSGGGGRSRGFRR